MVPPLPPDAVKVILPPHCVPPPETVTAAGIVLTVTTVAAEAALWHPLALVTLTV